MALGLDVRTSRYASTSHELVAVAAWWGDSFLMPDRSLRDWVLSSPRGTTPAGLASRLSAPPLITLTAVYLSLSDFPWESVGAGLRTAILLGLAAIVAVLIVVLPWVADRLIGHRTAALPRAMDLAITVPSGAASMLAILLIGMPAGISIAVVVLSLQLVLAVVAPLIAGSRRR
jgi:hypothetical protein